MDPVLELQQLKSERETLLAKANDNTLTAEDTERADTVAKRMVELQQQIEKRDKATAALQNAIAGGGKAEPSKTAKEAGDAGDDTDNASPRSLGQRFVKSAAMRDFREANPMPVEGRPVSIKADNLGGFVAKASGDPAPVSSSLGGAVDYYREPGIVDLTYPKPLTILDLISRGTTASSYVEYRQLQAIASAAAVVGENALKPLSQLTMGIDQAVAHVVADGFKVTNQELADDGIIASLLDSVLQRNLWEKVADLVFNGTGTNEPTGIFNTTGVLNTAFNTDMVTTIRKAITQLRTTSRTQVQAVMLNPEDDEALDLLQDANQRYYGNGPFGNGPNTIWGRPRIADESVPVGTAVLGDFSSVNLLERQGLTIQAFNQNEDDARHNLTYIRAEVREMLLIREPAKLAIAELTSGV